MRLAKPCYGMRRPSATSRPRTPLLFKSRRPRDPVYTPTQQQCVLGRVHHEGGELKYFIGNMGLTLEPGEPRPPSRALGWLLALPLGFVIAFAIFLLLVEGGHYFLGEFFVIFIAAFAVMFFVRLQYRQSRRNYWRARMQANAPARILRERYARGEISREQFHQMMRDLREGHRPPPDQQT